MRSQSTISVSTARTIASAIASAAVLIALLAAGGCDPATYDFRVFDDLAEQTWVDSTGAPEGLSSRIFGVAVGGGPSSGNGASYFVAARDDDAVVSMRYAANGELSTTIIPYADINPDTAPHPLPLRPVMAVVGDTADVGLAVTGGGTVDAPTGSYVVTFDAENGALSGTVAVLPIAQPIAGLAFGATNASANTAVAVGGNHIGVVDDALSPTSTSSRCSHGREIGLSAAMGDFSSATPGNEVAVAVADTAGGAPSTVAVTTVELIALADSTAMQGEVAPCFELGTRDPIGELTAPGNETDFGAVMVTGDFDGNGAIDLAVSAPGDNAVYVYMNLDLVVGTPPGEPVSLSVPENVGDFGISLAAGDLDGDGGDELIVGAPTSQRGGEIAAGAAYLYALEDGGEFSTTPHLLGDAQPESNQRFGQSIDVVPFGAGAAVLVIGAEQEVFTYFRTQLSPDVREGRGE